MIQPEVRAEIEFFQPIGFVQAFFRRPKYMKQIELRFWSVLLDKSGFFNMKKLAGNKRHFIHQNLKIATANPIGQERTDNAVSMAKRAVEFGPVEEKRFGKGIFSQRQPFGQAGQFVQQPASGEPFQTADILELGQICFLVGFKRHVVPKITFIFGNLPNAKGERPAFRSNSRQGNVSGKKKRHGNGQRCKINTGSDDKSPGT